MKKLSLTLLFSLLIPQTIHANALDRFFSSLGAQTNLSTPGSFQDQAAGYYTGGGYVMRQGSSAIQPINISLPKFGVGCNSLDLYFGSFSFISKDQLVQMARRIATAVPTYVFQLGLKTYAPQIENTMAQIRKYVQDMNNLMLNECQAAQQIVGGMLPKGSAMHDMYCKEQNMGHNQDWFGAKDHCNNDAKVAQSMKKAEKDSPDLLVGEYNLVFHVLKKMPEYADNEELRNFVMSLMGTLISRKEGDRFRLYTIEPRADQEEFVSAYLKSGQTSQLVCNDQEKCLAPTNREITIDDKATMKTKVLEKVRSLREKYQTLGAITTDEIAFLNDAVNLPIWRYIHVSVAAGSQFLMQDAAEYIGAMILFSQFDKVMSQVIEAIDSLEKVQLEDSAIRRFKANIQQARSRVQALLVGAKAGSIATLNAEIKALEAAIISRNS